MIQQEKGTSASARPLSAEAVASALQFAMIQESAGRLDSARLALQALVFMDPGNAYYHARLGSVYQKQGKYENAERHYTEALKLFPEDINSLTNRGEIQLAGGKVADAIRDLRRSVDLDPERKHPSANRARLLLLGIQEALEVVSEKGLDALKDLGK